MRDYSKGNLREKNNCVSIKLNWRITRMNGEELQEIMERLDLIEFRQELLFKARIV